MFIGLTFETQENLHSKELLNTQKHIVKNIRRYRRGCQARGSQGSSTTSSSPDKPFPVFRILIFISPPPTCAQRQTGYFQTQSRPEKEKNLKICQKNQNLDLDVLPDAVPVPPLAVDRHLKYREIKAPVKEMLRIIKNGKADLLLPDLDRLL